METMQLGRTTADPDWFAFRGSHRSKVPTLPASPSLLISRLKARKVSKAGSSAAEAKFSRHFKDVFSIGNVGVRSLPGQPATRST